MGYMISKTGKIVETHNETTLEDAVKNRIYEMETLVKDGSELELDYDNEKDVWYAANYSETSAASTFIEDRNNKPVIAFSGMDNKALTNIFDKLDIYYVP